MDKLKELSLILNKHKLGNIRVVGIGNNGNKESKLEQFYEALSHDQIKDDDDAAQILGYSDKKNGNYRTLKLRLQKQMLNTIFFLDPQDFNERDKAFQQCFKEWAAVKILYLRQARKTAVALSKNILRTAQKHELVDIVYEVCYYLRGHYATRQNDINKFNFYNNLYHESLKEKIAKDQADEFYSQLVFKIRSKAPKEVIYQTATEYYSILEGHLEKYDNSTLILMANLILIYKYLAVHDYEKTIEVCEKAIDLMEKKPKQNDIALGAFLHQKLICYIQLKQYEEGIEAAKKSAELSLKGTFNWFARKIEEFMLALHTKHYQNAYETYSEVIKTKGLKFMPDFVKEMWAVYRAYIHYLVDIGEIHLAEADKEFSKFRLNKFLNDVPGYSKDKRGLNVPILIIHFLFMIHQERYDEAFERIEAMEKYCHRYLKKDDTFRSNCFIKMLIQIPISGFSYKGAMRRGEKYLNKLNEVPLDVANQSHEVEIMPYEDLWNFATNTLKGNYH